MTRPPRSLTPARPKLRHPMIVLLLLPLLTMGAGAQETPAVASGPGTWHDGNTTSPAEAEWSYLGQTISAFRVTFGDDLLHCVHGHLLLHMGTTSRTGTCSGHPTSVDRVALRARTGDSRWNGTFTTTTTQPFGADTSQGPDGWNTLGVTVTAIAASAAAAAVLLLVLYLRERRFKDYLVRRLWEETQGRFPYDVPEGQSRELYARILVKGKN